MSRRFSRAHAAHAAHAALVVSSLSMLLASCEQSITIGNHRMLDGGLPSCANPLVADVLSVSEAHGCALRLGHVYCWGHGSAGQLGNADTIDVDRPVSIESIDTFRFVTTSSLGSCAIRTDDTLFCWGENFTGSLANGGSQNSSTLVETIGGVAEVSMGPGFVLTRNASGLLTVWGDNDDGQLGLGAAAVGMAFRTETVVTGSSFAMLAAADQHACVLDGAGHASCSGSNVNGQLGMPVGGSRDTFTALATPLTFSRIEGGYDRTCAITTQGALYCWGVNFPEWIPSTQGTVGTPTRIGTEADFTQVSIAFHHACALRDGGRLFCWGSNEYGELGFAGEPQTEPIEVTPGTTYSYVSAGWGYTCAIRATDSVVICMGRNEGRLGRGADTTSTPAPVCFPD